MDRQKAGAPAPAAMVMDAYIAPTLIRYVGRYHWSFNMARRLINLYYGTDYTERQLMRLYKKNRLD